MLQHKGERVGDKKPTFNQKKVFFGLYLYRKPEASAFYSSLRAGARLLKKHGYSVDYGLVMFDPYTQLARNTLANEFLRSKSDIFVFVADDLEYKAEDLLKLIETPGDVVAGVYRQKIDNINYPVMVFGDKDKRPTVRQDGCIKGYRVQTGFLRINRTVFEQIIEGFPELSYYGLNKGKKFDLNHDFFPQGVHNHRWIGEDYAFCDLWRELGGEIWIIPDLDLTHWQGAEKGYPGNYHEYLKQLPGGINYGKKQKLERVCTMRDDPSQSLAPLINSLSIQNGIMVEIGVYTGESTEVFQQSGMFKTIHAVDPWLDGYDYNEDIADSCNMDIVEELFDKRVKDYKEINKIKSNSMDAVSLFEDNSLDFIYIDGDHSYEAVKKDILSWRPKVKTGGIIAGHDYELYEEVKKAVDEIFGTVAHFPDSSWMFKLKE